MTLSQNFVVFGLTRLSYSVTIWVKKLWLMMNWNVA